MKEKLVKKRKKFIFSVIMIAVVLSAYCICVGKLTGMLTSQSAVRRWKGESEQKFAQISCFVPVDEQITLTDVYSFRQVMAEKFKDAGLNADNGEKLMNDAWSTSGKVSVSSALGSGEVYACAVGGDFFFFHPVKLLSGNYLNPSDLMKDRVLLDEETAWLLFGGTDVHGMGFKIEDKYFVVAGVFERESDIATEKAYTDGRGIFMSYDAFCSLTEESFDGTVKNISCYEAVMPEPVKGFAEAAAKDKFPIGRGEILNNTERYSTSRLIKLVRQFGTRSMQNKGIMYPYWENAARYTEDVAALITAIAIILLFVPSVIVVVTLISSAAHFKRKLGGEILPEWRDQIEDAASRRRYNRRNNKPLR